MPIFHMHLIISLFPNNFRLLYILWLVVFFQQVRTGESQINDFWVRPIAKRCPSSISNSSCFTLSELARINRFPVHTTVHFLPGNHTVTESKKLVFGTNVETLSLIGETEEYCPHQRDCNSFIECTHEKFCFVIFAQSLLQISGLSISGCGCSVMISKSSQEPRWRYSMLQF